MLRASFLRPYKISKEIRQYFAIMVFQGDLEKINWNLEKIESITTIFRQIHRNFTIM